MNFKEQIEKSNDEIIIKIRDYLFSRKDISRLLEKEDKNINDMMMFVQYNVLKKNIDKLKANRGTAVVEDDDYVFGLIVHYLDENIDIKKIKKEMEKYPSTLSSNKQEDERFKKSENEYLKKENEELKKKIKDVEKDALKKARKEIKDAEIAKKKEKKMKKEKFNEMQIGFDL